MSLCRCGAATYSPRASRCTPCAKLAKNSQTRRSNRHNRNQRVRDRLRERVLVDFSPDQIEARYIRAVWQRHPAKAIKLWQAWKVAA